MTVLVTGGCGYIGKHLLNALIGLNVDVICLDSLATGEAGELPHQVDFIEGDILDANIVNRVFQENKITHVYHLAALKSISESSKKPDLYRQVNIEGTKVILEAAVKHNVKKFIFASSAAVYGNSFGRHVQEGSQTNPVSLYGETKLKSELLINSAVRANEIQAVSLRLFNVAGAANLRMADKNRDNLIPIVIDSIRNGKALQIFGEDFDTPDGTCIRDFIHVSDVSCAMVSAGFSEKPLPSIINVATGIGTSVLEIIKHVEKNMQSKSQYSVVNRRIGEVSKMVADISLFKKELGNWPLKTIEEIVTSAIGK